MGWEVAIPQEQEKFDATQPLATTEDPCMDYSHGTDKILGSSYLLFTNLATRKYL